jgi:glutaredoxin
MMYIMYVLIGKEKCNRCDVLKNLLDEKGIQYRYLDATVV